MKKNFKYIQGIVNIQKLIDSTQCYQTVRDIRWPDGIILCPHCDSKNTVRHGYHSTESTRRRYYCQSCDNYFDDLTKSIFQGHHQPLSVWILCLYFMGLNISNSQIAKELGLNISDVQNMTTQLREAISEKKPEQRLRNKVESDEVYIVAGHKGNSIAVKKKVEKEGATV